MIVFNKACILCLKSIYLNGICSQCWNKFRFINNSCSLCGHSINKKNINNILKCQNCPKNIENYIYKNISIFDYNKIGKKFILNLKNINSYYKSSKFLNLILKNNKILNYHIDLITYVPSHFLKYLIRGFNQSELIAKIIAKQSSSSKEVKSLLIKNKFISQSSQNFKERQSNIKNIFKAKKNINITNKTILIVDDVMTTGSTLIECAKELKQKGAKKIITFTLARTGLKQSINS